jgi:hypothetical protein
MTKKVEVDAIWLQQMSNTLKEARDTEMHHDMINYIETVISEIEEQKPPISEIELPDQ